MLSLLLILLLSSRVYGVQMDKIVPYSEDYRFQRNCYSTLYPPTKPETLVFCMQYNDLACCPPAQDKQNLDYFQSINDLGLACRNRGDVRRSPLAILYCLNCDPRQPKYVRNLPYFPLLSMQEFLNLYPLVGFPSWRVGKDNMPLDCFATSTDGSYTTTGNPMSYDRAYYQQCYATRRLQILISRAWMVEQFQIAPQVMSIFDGCMLQKSAPCLDNSGTILPNRERFACGNDLVNPGIFYGLEAGRPAYSDGLPGMCALNGFKANGLLPGDDNCRMLYLEKAINQDDLGTPGVADYFGIRLVDDRLCSSSDYAAWVSALQAQLETVFINSSTINSFNAHVLNGPTCRMTKAQVLDSARRFAWPPVNLTPEYASDELCYSSAAPGSGGGDAHGMLLMVAVLTALATLLV